ncbi:SH3 and cysteine-rich domain-containing protein isoform X9 [Rhodnius prolixus]|uniref:SH3 and cysteine-rich domain-containing protein isoform X9 n=1 Tax=Rhodnius prolixus TaxID=13249 RepID=UPI003D18E0D4
MYIICPAHEVIEYTLPSRAHLQHTTYYSGRSGGFTRTMESMKGLAHPAVWPNVKNHITTSLAVVKNLSDFAQELSQMYEHHAEELQLLVGNYRKKNAELRKDGVRGCSSMQQLWETLLQEVEADSQAHGEIASVLGRQVSRDTLEKTFYRKLEARKLLQHRDCLDAVLSKSQHNLSKLRQDYKTAFSNHCQSPNSQVTLAAYLDAHNAYVNQLHATNAMVDLYSKETLPELLQELEQVYSDLCTTLAEAVAQGAEIISNRAGDQSRRYYTVWTESKAVDPGGDTAALVRSMTVPTQPHPSHRLRLFTPPQTDQQQETNVVQLKNALVFDKPASIQIGQAYEGLQAETDDLTAQIQHLQDSLTTMLRIQQRSIESNLYNKANEIQEDISMKRYEMKTAQLNLVAAKAKKELFSAKMETGEGGSSGVDRKMSSVSTASMKSKWLKAFKSLKTPPPTSNGKEQEKEKKNQMYHAVSTIIAMRRNGKEVAMVGGDSSHQFQEYTYKKITPCDVCSQVLRGHTRQGLKCRLCKMNVHIDCQERASKCQTKSRLLRRQKSSSEIETRTNPGDEEGLLGEFGRRPGRSVSPGGTSSGGISPGGFSTDSFRPPLARSVTFRSSTPGDPGGGLPPSSTREVLVDGGLRPEDTTYQVLKTANEISISGSRAGNIGPVEQRTGPVAGRRSNHTQHHHHQSASSGLLYMDWYESTSSAKTAPSSPVHSRRLLSARNMRMSSVELPDDNEKSVSSASTSPCPSPKPHRLLPTNLYVVLYNFKSRHSDELDLKAGYKLTVIDTSDPDWWRGKCLGRVGYFPSKYVAKVQPGERALQVTHNLQVADCTLLRDQIVIQIGEEVDGMVMIRSGDNRQGVCPVKYLTEV